MTEEVVAALDVCRVSYRNTVRLIAAITYALEIDIQSLIINKSYFNVIKRKRRAQMAEKVKNNFGKCNLTVGVLHWDGSTTDLCALLKKVTFFIEKLKNHVSKS